MLFLKNDRYEINFLGNQYDQIVEAINTEGGFPFILSSPIYPDYSQYNAVDILSVIKNKREGLRSLQVRAYAHKDGTTKQMHIAHFVFKFVGSPKPLAGPYFQLISTGVHWGNDTVVMGKSEEFQKFIRDHDDCFVTCRFGNRKFLGKFKRTLPLPAHNPTVRYACQLHFPRENRDLDVFFYQ